jgi:23S rRNA (cytidine1920-2'-O)/16S rRNA (cytidine1409-2'-O)-methyltransferase
LKHVLPAALARGPAGGHRRSDQAAVRGDAREVKKGIVRDPQLHRRVCEEIAAFAAALGLTRIVHCDSPIAGADGNREFFIGAHLG